MNDQADKNKKIPKTLKWAVPGVLILSALLLIISILQKDNRPLKPIRSTPTPAPVETINNQPTLVTFPELNEDPFAFRDQLIRVTGAYTPAQLSNCVSKKGPDIRWSLIADDLQLDAIGFENILRLVAPNTILTIDGIWRLYTGPVGCGKGPTIANVWYLEVTQIIQPNPLIHPGGFRATPPTGESSTPISQTIPLTTPTPETIEISPTLTSGTPILTTTIDPLATNTAVALTPLTPGIATTTPFINPTQSTRTPFAQTVTATPTFNAPQNPTSTRSNQPVFTPTPTATFTIGPSSTPFPTIPPFNTATPGSSYPGPGTSTPTPDSYP